jgi:hypothetical protein
LIVLQIYLQQLTEVVCSKMVALTGGAVAISGAAANGILGISATTGALTGLVTGMLNAAATAGSSAAIVAKSAAGGMVVGAIGGTVTAGAATGAVVASMSGAATAATVSSVITGATGLALSSTTAAILSGPVGWIVLGAAAEIQSPGVYTFDCWKVVLHDDSSEPSNGRLLKDLIKDPRIKQVTTTTITTKNDDNDLPHLILENIWDEQFSIEYVYLESTNQLAAHAVKV